MNAFIAAIFYIYKICRIDILSTNAKIGRYDDDKNLINLSLRGYEYIELFGKVYVRYIKNSSYKYLIFVSIYQFFNAIEQIDKKTESKISLWLEFKYVRQMRKIVYRDGHMSPLTYSVSMSKLPRTHKFDEYLIWNRSVDGINIYGSVKSILTMSKLHDEIDKILYGVR